MRILLINNSTKHIEHLTDALSGHDIEIVEYQPGVVFDTNHKDMVVLSGGGGEGREANDLHDSGHLWYQDEIDFIRTADKPILGICMGFELVCQAYGSKVKKMIHKVKGIKTIQFGSRKLQQVNIHDWHISSVPKELLIKGYSDTGIEIVEHKDRPITAVQFHPELGGSLMLSDLLPQLLN